MRYVNRWNNLNTTEQINTISSIINNHRKQVKCVYAENNGIGSPMNDLLSDAIKGINFKRFTTTNNSKQSLVKNMQVAIEQKKITLVNDNDLLNEFSTYASEYNEKTRIVTFNAISGCHDDIPMSVMIAYECYLKENNNNYSFLFV